MTALLRPRFVITTLWWRDGRIVGRLVVRAPLGLLTLEAAADWFLTTHGARLQRRAS